MLKQGNIWNDAREQNEYYDFLNEPYKIANDYCDINDEFNEYLIIIKNTINKLLIEYNVITTSITFYEDLSSLIINMLKIIYEMLNIILDNNEKKNKDDNDNDKKQIIETIETHNEKEEKITYLTYLKIIIVSSAKRNLNINTVSNDFINTRVNYELSNYGTISGYFEIINTKNTYNDPYYNSNELLLLEYIYIY